MKMKILKILCGNDHPLPTASLTQLMFIACVFAFSSYVQADVVTNTAQSFERSSGGGSLVLLVFGFYGLLAARRRKPPL